MKKKYKATLALGIVSIGIIGIAQPPVIVEASTSVLSNQYPNVNTYIKQQNLRTAKITQNYKQFLQFDYRNGNGQAEGILIHETANKNSTIFSEINYMTLNWQNAFVHAFVDKDYIIQIHPADFAVWGAGKKANPRFYQIELVEHNTFHQFAQSVNNDAYLAAYMLHYYNLEPSRATKSGGGTVWTHDEVSRYLGGTNHTDPVGYFKKWGYSVNEFYDLVVKTYNNIPNQVFKEKSLDRKYALPVDSKNYGIWNGLYPDDKSVKVGDLHSYNNQPITVYKEVRNKNGDWVQIGQNGKVLGWVGKTGVQITPVLSTPVENAHDFGVWDNYENGMKQVGNLLEFANSEIKLIREATANNGVEWVEFSSNDKTIGWVAKTGVVMGSTPVQIPKPVSKLGTPVAQAYNFGVWNDVEKGSKRVAGLSDFVGKQLEITNEKTSLNGVKWVEFALNGKVIGWVAESGIQYGEIQEPITKLGTPVAQAYNFGVWDDVEKGSKRVAGLSDFVGKQLEITNEKTSLNGVKWVEFALNGKVIGWVAESGIQYGEIQEPITKLGTPVAKAYNFGVWNDVEKGSKRVAGLSDFVGKQLEITNEKTSLNGVKWVEFALNGKVIGWVAESGIQYGEIQEPIAKLGTPVAKAYNFGVWNDVEKGSKRVAGLSDFVGKQLEITNEKTSLNGVKWVEFALNGKVIGWVAESGIQYGEIQEPIAKLGTPVAKAYNFGVWNDIEKGSKRVAGLSDFVGKQLEITNEKTSLNGVKWVEFALNGKVIGWVAESGIQYGELPKPVSKLGTPVAQAYNFGVWDDIEKGSKRVAGLSSFVGKQLEITNEKTSLNGVKWVEFASNGRVIGWVAESGIRYGELPQSISKLGTPVAQAYNFGIWNDIEKGNKRVAGLSDFVGKQLEITKEVSSLSGLKWVEFALNGKVIGWVAESGIRYGETPQPVSKLGTPVAHAYDFGVWNTFEQGNTRITGLYTFIGKRIEVTKEVISLKGVKWVEFALDGKIIGWVAESGIRYGETPQAVSKLSTPVVNAYDFGVWNDFEKGNQRVTGLSNFVGKQIELTKEVSSLNGVKWVEFALDGKIIGWVAESGVQIN
ncbi:GW dipeptide domain-containing protein [Carnobacterium sp. TMP28]|uniref:GW dipeptide domain-containing protein n=1 Tax=Carnobacterium sp. TMP28 TaxID=3397060 RepID=UPI0039E1848E